MEEFRFVSFFVAVSVRPGNLEVEEGHDLQSKLKAHTVLQDQDLWRLFKNEKGFKTEIYYWDIWFYLVVTSEWVELL